MLIQPTQNNKEDLHRKYSSDISYDRLDSYLKSLCQGHRFELPPKENLKAIEIVLAQIQNICNNQSTRKVLTRNLDIIRPIFLTS